MIQILFFLMKLLLMIIPQQEQFLLMMSHKLHELHKELSQLENLPSRNPLFMYIGSSSISLSSKYVQ